MTEPADMSDDEMDAAVATEVMGWHRRPDAIHQHRGWYKRDPVSFQRPGGWSPATDIAAAFDVVERMRLNPALFVRYWHCLTVWAHRQPVDGAMALQCGDAAVLWHLTPRAICEAALSAVRSET